MPHVFCPLSVIDVSLEERVYSVVEGKEVLTVYVLTDRADFTVTGAVVLNITLLTAGGLSANGPMLQCMICFSTALVLRWL